MSHGYRLALQFGIVALFYGGKKLVHIYVDNLHFVPLASFGCC
jgi:hypothetical protein